MSNQTDTVFKIHPAIGIARLGNSDEFYLAPEQPGAAPIECDSEGIEQRDKQGQPLRVSHYKEKSDLSKLKRQAARFRIFAYSDDLPGGQAEIEIGSRYQFIIQSAVTAPTAVQGTVTDINWTVHLANKKSSWYEFIETDGSHGYSDTHPLRNASVDEPNRRRQLIIDPGPKSVSGSAPRASFDKGDNPGYPQTFPPDNIKPHAITTLGELIATNQDGNPRLVVLGGRGHSGSSNVPVISSFVNNDDWYDDISDGPVTAEIEYEYEFDIIDDQGNTVTQSRKGSMAVQVPAWVVVGYPRYVPQMQDMITLDESMYDLFVRYFHYQPAIYGVAPFDEDSNSPETETDLAIWRNDASYNPDYYPKFYEEIWPLLSRPNQFSYTFDFDSFEGADPHNTGTGGNLSQAALSTPPGQGEDKYKQQRDYIYSILRQPWQRNLYTNDSAAKSGSSKKPRLMPMLCGNNPISNTAAQKFLNLTRTQLFLLEQWMKGKFINECEEWKQDDGDCQMPWDKPPTTGTGIDRGVLSNMLGGAYCPGGELSWIVQNPALYSEPYRIKHTTYQAGGLSLPQPIAEKDGSASPDLSRGNEPGDLTKYIGIPWQADFHECTTQDIDITYEEWNAIDLASVDDPAKQQVAYEIPWWPAHRPIVVHGEGSAGQQIWASGVPDNKAGDLAMVSAWNSLGFIVKASAGDTTNPAFYQVERDDANLGPPLPSGKQTLGRTRLRTEDDE